MIGLGFLLLSSALFSSAHAADCVWLYRENPYAGPAECLEFAYPPPTSDRPFSFVEDGHGLTIEDAVRASNALASAAPAAPFALIAGNIQHTRDFQAWALRMSAHHLGLMHAWLRNGLRRDFPSRALTVHVSTREMGMGLMDKRLIELGGRYTLTSETPYHEYGHHVLEWERPGLMANCERFKDNRVGYGLIEAWANHFAFVLDGEPRFAEYQHSLTHSLRYAYSVDNDCTLAECDEGGFDVDDSYRAVIVYGGLLWDLRGEAGGDDSVALMMDSLAYLDLSHPLSYRGAVDALVRADERRFGGTHAAFIRSRAAARGL